jgi:hypothetical protein
LKRVVYAKIDVPGIIGSSDTLYSWTDLKLFGVPWNQSIRSGYSVV